MTQLIKQQSNTTKTMKTFKLIVISIILFLGMWIISWDTTFASAEVQTIQIIAFFTLVAIVWILATKSDLFKGIINENENQA